MCPGWTQKGANPEGSLAEFCYKEEQRPAGWWGRVRRTGLRMGRIQGPGVALAPGRFPREGEAGEV